MKKIIIILIIAVGFTGNSFAQTDTAQKNNKMSVKPKPGATKYFYYPEANVYFNEANASYSYYEAGSATWVTSQQLPASYNINKNTTSIPIDYNGADVWTDNAVHKKKY